MFKVGDKVRCKGMGLDTSIGYIYDISETDYSRAYNIRITDDIGEKQWVNSDRFELVQEDKLPHELLGLPKYWVVEIDMSNPLCRDFLEWYKMDSGFEYCSGYKYYGNDSTPKYNGYDHHNKLELFKNNPTIISLEERDRCVKKREINDVREKAIDDAYSKERQTKKLSKPIRSCEHNGSIYKEDTIDGVSIEDMKATRDNINSKLLTHRNLFLNPNKGHYKNK